MDNLKKLEEILKKCIENGWQPFGVEGYNFDDYKAIDYCRWSNHNDYSSWHEVFSQESGLLQFMKWKENGDFIAILSWGGNTKEKYETYSRKYHAMMMSILSAEEKIDYFINSVVVDKDK